MTMGHPTALATIRALVVRGLLDNRRAPLTWGGSLGLFCGLIVAMWPSIEDSIAPAVDTYPDALKQAFNIEALDSVEAYLDVEMFSLVVPLALAFFAVRCAIRLVVSAEEHRLLDTLLAAPVPRRLLVAASFAVTAIATAAILAVIWVIAMIAGVLVGVDPSAGDVAAGAANVWPLALFFAGFATLLAGVMHRAVPVTAVAAGTLVAMYVVDLLGKTAEPMEPLRYLSAFKYYGSAIQDGIDPAAFAGLTAAAAVLAACGAVLFERRDVYA
jgi:ABC-2 type transport system permease protein